MEERHYLKNSPTFPVTKESDETSNWRDSLSAKHNQSLKKVSSYINEIQEHKRDKIARQRRDNSLRRKKIRIFHQHHWSKEEDGWNKVSQTIVNVKPKYIFQR